MWGWPLTAGRKSGPQQATALFAVEKPYAPLIMLAG